MNTEKFDISNYSNLPGVMSTAEYNQRIRVQTNVEKDQALAE